MDLRRITMPVSELIGKEAPYNPRKISADARAGLRASLKRFGQVQDIVFNERTQRIVGGHKRLQELIDSGATEVSVTIGSWSDSDEKALNIALNSPMIAGSFTDDLQGLLSELEAVDSELFGELLLTDLVTFQPENEWQGMPEFVQLDKTAFRTLIVNFKDTESVDAFAKAIGQHLTDKTRSIWFPLADREIVSNKHYGVKDTP